MPRSHTILKMGAVSGMTAACVLGGGIGVAGACPQAPNDQATAAQLASAPQFGVIEGRVISVAAGQFTIADKFGQETVHTTTATKYFEFGTGFAPTGVVAGENVVAFVERVGGDDFLTSATTPMVPTAPTATGVDILRNVVTGIVVPRHPRTDDARRQIAEARPTLTGAARDVPSALRVDQRFAPQRFGDRGDAFRQRNDAFRQGNQDGWGGSSWSGSWHQGRDHPAFGSFGGGGFSR